MEKKTPSSHPFTSFTRTTVVDGLAPFAGKVVAFRFKSRFFGGDQECFRIGGEKFGYIHWKAIRGTFSALRRFIVPGTMDHDCMLIPGMLRNPIKHSPLLEDCTFDVREATAEERAALFKAQKAGETRLDYQGHFKYDIAWE